MLRSLNSKNEKMSSKI